MILKNQIKKLCLLSHMHLGKSNYRLTPAYKLLTCQIQFWPKTTQLFSLQNSADVVPPSREFYGSLRCNVRFKHNLRKSLAHKISVAPVAPMKSPHQVVWDGRNNFPLLTVCGSKFHHCVLHRIPCFASAEVVMKKQKKVFFIFQVSALAFGSLLAQTSAVGYLSISNSDFAVEIPRHVNWSHIHLAGETR